MVLHQFPTMYVDESFTNVGRPTSYIRTARDCMIEFKCRSRVIEFIKVMHKAGIILCVKKNVAPLNSSVNNMIEFHLLQYTNVGRRTSYIGLNMGTVAEMRQVRHTRTIC